MRVHKGTQHKGLTEFGAARRGLDGLE